MTQVRDILFPNQGMNLDADGKFLKPNQTREIYNFRSGNTEGDNLGDRENMLGNTIETVRGDLPEGNNTSIGSCKDNKNNAIIWFIHNSEDNHCILHYYKNTGSIRKILFEESLLNFSLDYKINHSFVIGDLLYWTDNYNPPRKINLVKASNLTNPSTAADNLKYPALTEQILNRVKYPPLYPITLAYASDTNYKYNNLRGKMFQFAYLYIYDDFEKSVLSPVSKIGLPQGDELSNGNFIENSSVNNRIDLDINLSTTEVEKIEIYAREGNFGHWKMIKQIFKYDEDGEENPLYPSDTTYTYNFYNNQVGIVVDQKNLFRPFDYVPLLSSGMEIVEGNRIIDANYLEGYENTDIDIGLDVVKENIDFAGSVQEIGVTTLFLAAPIGYFSWRVVIPITYSTGQIVRLRLTDDPDYNPIIIIHTVTSSDTLWSIRTSLLEQLTEYGYLNAPTADDHIFYVYNYDFLTQADIDSRSLTGDVFDNTNALPTYKDGAWHEVGIVYLDRADRKSFVNLDESNSKIYIPSIGESEELGGPSSQFFKNTLRLEITNLGPSFATHFNIVYSKNISIKDYVWFSVLKSDIVRSTTKSRIEINFNEKISDTHEAFDKFNISEWDWKKGDRIRFLGYQINGSTAYVGESIDMEIIGVEYTSYKADDLGTFLLDGDGNKIQDIKTLKFLTQDFNYEQYVLFVATPSDVDLILLEVYRPLKSLIDSEGEAKQFYEIGETYAIENGYHQSGVAEKVGERDQTATQSAIIILDGGDSYAKLRVAANGYYPVYDPNFSDYYDSNFYDIGRVNIVNTEAKQVRLSANLRFSGKYIENTKINELSKVEFNDYDVLSENDGPINKIEYVGFTLKVYQQYKITSIYIGRTSFVDAQGKESLQITNNVIGTKLPSSTRYGTEHPESVVKSERNVYLVDINSKTILRDSPNGIREISGYNVKTWVRNIIETLQGSSYSDLRIYSGYNKRYDEITFTFIANVIALGTDIGYSVVFLEEDFDKGNWNYFPQYVDATGNYPQGYEGIGNLFVSFLKGDIWIHDSNTLRNNFYGDQKSIEINLVGNKEFLNVKNYLRMGVNANKAFDVEIKIDPCILYPSGMVSRIKAARFENKEGIWYAEFLKDMTTNSSTPSVDDLINGRPLQGQTIRLKLTNSDTDEVVLNSVIISGFISK